MQEMHSKRPPKNLVPLALVVQSPPTPKILPPTQIPIENLEEGRVTSETWQLHLLSKHCCI